MNSTNYKPKLSARAARDVRIVLGTVAKSVAGSRPTHVGFAIAGFMNNPTAVGASSFYGNYGLAKDRDSIRRDTIAVNNDTGFSLKELLSDD